MGKDEAREAGRRAWERLIGWHRGQQYAGHADTGDGALAALDDVGTVRRMLDQAELVAVRAARRHGKSWTEIATRLGVTRQSAWERWRDLDEQPDPAAPVALAPAARLSRRRSSVRVPDVVGMTWTDANSALEKKGLRAVGADGWPTGAAEVLDRIVTDQSPESGAKVPSGASVRLWFYQPGGGGAGVREPRRPKPDPTSGTAPPPEPADRATGRPR